MKLFSTEEMAPICGLSFEVIVTIVSAYMCFFSDEELNVKFCKSISVYRWESSYPLFGHELHQYLRDLVCIDPNAGLQTNNSKLNPGKC